MLLGQKRFIIGALLALSVTTTTAGSALRASNAVSRKRRLESPVDDAFSHQSMDKARLLEVAVKIETSSHLRHRLEEAGQNENQQEGQNEGENEAEQQQQENNDNENDNKNEENNEENQENQENNQDNQENNEENQENNNEQENEQEQEDNAENEEENQQQQEEENQGDEQEEENNQEQEDAEEDNAEEDAQNEEENVENDDEQEQQQDEEQEEEDQNNDQADEDAEEEEEEPQINFLKCVALTIEPDLLDVDEMVENGEIDEDEATELKQTSITEMTANLNTQESVVFFTYGNGPNDEDRAVYMIGINDWIAASSGYDQTCNALDQDDVTTVFSKVGQKQSVAEYSDHVWYSGFNCKADGTGFKPQLFLDETCTTFSPTLNQYYPFRKATESTGYLTEVSSDLTQYMTEDASDSIANAQYCEDSEFCEKVFDKSVELATCEEAKERRHLASYQLENDVASNIDDACPSIQGAFNMDEGYEYSSSEIEALVVFWSNTLNGGQESDRRSFIPGANDVWVYLLGLLAIVCIGSSLFVSQTKCSPPDLLKSSSSDLETVDSVDSKKIPLVEPYWLEKPVPPSESDLQQAYSAIECTFVKKKKKSASPSPSPTPEDTTTKKRKTKTNQFRQFLKKNLSGTSATSHDISVQ